MTDLKSTQRVRDLPVVRVFVSSTFSDLVAERNALADRVWPKLERYCRQRGFTFQAIDLRWGVPSEAGLNHRTMQICLEELHRAQETSPEPNFLILMGNKYGWRPLPETISESEFNQLESGAISTDERVRSIALKLEYRVQLAQLSENERQLWDVYERLDHKTFHSTLHDWYLGDANAQPLHYVLRARTDSPDDKDYTRVTDADGRRHSTPEWLAVQDALCQIVSLAFPGTLLAQRFAHRSDEVPAAVRFQASATEQEIWHGALKVNDAPNHVVACFREILGRQSGDPDASHLRRFIDLRADNTPDLDAANAITELKNKMQNVLTTVHNDQPAKDPIIRAECCWEVGPNGEFTGEVTTDHLIPMCNEIFERLKAIIVPQFKKYWGVDLSADDATVAVIRGTQQELDLELRNHRRFAEERGPLDFFLGRDKQVYGIRDYLASTTNRPLVVHGPSGSGKTALLAYVSQQPYETATDLRGVAPIVLTRFIGAQPESSTLGGLFSSLCRELRGHFPVTTTEKNPEGREITVTVPLPDTPQELTEEFYSQLARATAKRPIYVFLDALDQIEAAKEARQVDWIRSQIFPHAVDPPSCFARVVVSCLSPSAEFPLESEACDPFRRLQARGLLEVEELGLLEVSAAKDLLRRWLADQKRSLTNDQWQSVDADIERIESRAERRRPLYLKVLSEELRRWREFDPPDSLPLTLSQLLQETLARLTEPNQHELLPRIALGYLVSARYGLSEGELQEVLFLDPEIQSQLEASRIAYGHELPTGTRRYPIAPWTRLRSHLRFFLSERTAPGTTVLYCYHRQVEHAVRSLFLSEDATRRERQCRLAGYFDRRWDEPDAHAMMELPDLLLAIPDHHRLYDRLTDFAFPMRKAEVGLLESIQDDYRRLSEQGPLEIRQRLGVWQGFFREHAHILRRGMENQTVHKILLQLALEHADDSPVTIAAETFLAVGRCDALRLQRVPRLEHLSSNSCLAVFEGHTGWVNGALSLMDDRIVSWSSDTMLRLWDTATGGCRAVLEGHTHSVKGALSLPDGQILSWSNDHTLRLWDAETGTCRGVLEGHTGSIAGALSLPDRLILSWSSSELDNTLRVWDVATERCVAILKGHTSGVNGALSLPCGRILSWSRDRTLRVWDIATGNCCAVLIGHKSEIMGAQLLPNGLILSWSSSQLDNTLRVWDAATIDCVSILEKHSDGVTGAFSLPDGRILSWSSSRFQTSLRLWDAATGGSVALLKGHTSGVNGALSLPGGRLLSWSQDTTLRVWDVATGDSVGILKGHTREVNGALSLAGGRILSWSGDRTLRLWDSVTGDCVSVLEGHTAGVTGALLLPDGRILSWSGDLGSTEKSLFIWDATTGARRAALEKHADSVVGALSLPDGQILTWSNDTTLRLWDAATGACRAVLEGHTDQVKGALSLSECQILSWSFNNKTLRLWDTATGDCCAVLQGHMREVRGVMSLSDGRVLSWSGDNTLRLWDPTTGDCRAVLQGHTSAVNGVLLLSDGRVLSWSADNTLRLWDVAAAACCGVLEGHTSPVFGALPLSGDRILSWSWDNTLRVWDAATGKCRAVLEGHLGGIWGSLAHPDGRILSWSQDKTLRLWDSVTGACRAVLKGHTCEIEGVVWLPDGRILSWSLWTRDDAPRLWDAANGACLEVVPNDDLAVHHPDWFHQKRLAEKPASVFGNWCADANGRTTLLFHRDGFAPFAAWQSGADSKAILLQPDGTLVIAQADHQVCILKLYHGNRRVSLAEAEDFLRSTGQIPQNDDART